MEDEEKSTREGSTDDIPIFGTRFLRQQHPPRSDKDGWRRGARIIEGDEVGQGGRVADAGPPSSIFMT